MRVIILLKTLILLTTMISSSTFAEGKYIRLHCPQLERCKISQKIPKDFSPIDFILVSDIHSDMRIKVALLRNHFLAEVRELGTINYGIEIANDNGMANFLQKYNKGEVNDLISAPGYMGPTSNLDENDRFIEVAEKMHSARFKLFAIDHPMNTLQAEPNKWPCRNSREREITRNFIAARRNGPVLSLIGARHSLFSSFGDKGIHHTNSTAVFLVNAGFNVLSIGFSGTQAEQDIFPEMTTNGSDTICKDYSSEDLKASFKKIKVPKSINPVH